MSSAGIWTADQVRKQFFDFFESKEHTFIPSSPTVPTDDPIRLFANAGMNQFRSILLGQRPAVKRVYNSQKCIRAGDLRQIGKDSYHHSFFEMLGTWSFGGYSKKEAIAYAWELLTEVYSLPTNSIYITYFEGDPQNGLVKDDETQQLWLQLGVAKDHIVPGKPKDNFWDMGIKGAPGPCGPSTEIHFDRIGGRNAAHLVNQDDPDVIEIWNIVFVQFSREVDGTFRPLPLMQIDTGVGLERLVSVVQGKKSNYATDLFLPILQKIEELSNKRPYEDKFKEEDIDGVHMAYRIIADHIRALTFALSDGGYFGAVGRGYMLRGMLRRSLWYAREKLEVPLGSFLASLLPTVVEHMANSFPELAEKCDIATKMLNEEEGSFLCHLADGIRLFKECLEKARELGSKLLSEKDVWNIYDTYGFPLDLIQSMAEDEGLVIGEYNFEKHHTSNFIYGW